MLAPPLRRCCTVALAAWGAVAQTALGQAPTPDGAASYWRQRAFVIPFQANFSATPGARPARVELLGAQTGVSQWKVLQTAEPTVRGFSFNAPADGQYDFAVRTVDERGNASPAVITQPQLRIIVDTQLPQLRMNATTDSAGRLAVRYEATDAFLRGESLRFEVQTEGGSWQPVTLGAADIRQPDRVLGQWTWQVPLATRVVNVRGGVEDRAGNRGVATTTATMFGGRASSLASSPNTPPAASDSGPLLSAPLTGSGGTSLDGPTLTGPSLGAASNSAATTNPFATPSVSAAPPPTTPYANTAARTPAHLVSDNGSNAAPPLIDLNSAPATSSAPPATASDVGSDQWTSAANMDEPDGGCRWVNSLTFDVDYDLQTVGPMGVSRVELWATKDDGRTWTSLGPDADNRGPMRVTMPGPGVYGFRITVDGANGATAPRPQAGDVPELVIGVDLEPPRAALMGAKLGTGSMANYLVIRWSGADDNLETRPIGLFVSEKAEGPWSTIATDLANTGEYTWQLTQNIPRQIHLRLDVRDKAGNVTSRRSPSAITLELPQPKGRLRAIRPVRENEQRYRTASGPRPAGDR